MSFKIIMNGNAGACLVSASGQITPITLKRKRVGDMEIVEVNTEIEAASNHSLNRAPIGTKRRIDPVLAKAVKSALDKDLVGFSELVREARVSGKTINQIMEKGELAIVGNKSAERLKRALDDLNKLPL